MKILPAALLLNPAPGSVENAPAGGGGSEKPAETVAEKPAELFAGPTAPALIETKPKNDKISGKTTAGKAGLVQRLRKKTASVFGFRKGPGRPKNCEVCNGGGCESCDYTGKQPGKLDGGAEGGPGHVSDVAPLEPASGLPAGSPMVQSVVAAPAAPDRGARFRRSVRSVVSSVFGMFKAVTTSMSETANLRPEFIEKLKAADKDEDEAVTAFTEDLDAVLVKYNKEPEHAEEIALGASFVRLIGPRVLVLWELRQEIKRNGFSHEARQREVDELRAQLAVLSAKLATKGDA